MNSQMEFSIVIDVIKGGFVMSYPAETKHGEFVYLREVFVSPRKLNQKLKEVLDLISTTPDDSVKSE